MAREVVDELDSYAEISPSGRGVHVLVRAKLPKGRNRRGPIEIYDRGRYFTVTGRHLEGTPRTVGDGQEEILACARRLLGDPPGASGDAAPPTAEPGLPDGEVIAKVGAARNGEKFRRLWAGDASGYGSASEADLALCSRLAFYTGQDRGQMDRLFRRSGLYRAKWDRADYREKTVTRALAGRTEFYRPGSSAKLKDNGTSEDDPGREEVGTLLSEVEAEDLEWLWRSRLPLGKLALVDGDPGLGKSAVTQDLAARVSSGAGFPDGATCAAAGVVLLSAEDGLSDTIRPRLDAAGADASRVLSMATVPDENGQGRLVSVPEDLPLIERAIERVEAGLVVVDPLMAFLSGGTNSHRDQDVRRALAPLAALADRTGACVLVVRHLSKAGGNNPLYRGGGSIGIIGAARVGFLAATKNNLAKHASSLLFELEEADNGAVRVIWRGESDIAAHELLAAPRDEERADAREEAADFLNAVLAEGPQPVSEIEAEADDAGIAPATLRRAKKILGVEAHRENTPGEKRGSGRWVWKLPAAKLHTEGN